MKTKSYPLHWFTFVLLTLGFLCNLLAFVLPFWYAKFPQSRNDFLNLGLWEVCFSDFMPESLGNVMYTGCFYIYDRKISNIWPTIFRGLFVLIDLITMGVGVDNESKRLPRTDQKWLKSLDQCTLSWSYGLSALSFLGSFCTLIILSWFVYPKRSSDRLLTVNAWNWPSRSEILCQPQVNDLHYSREYSRANSSNRSRSIMSTSGDQVQSITRPLISARQLIHPILISNQAASKMANRERQQLGKTTPIAHFKDTSFRSSSLSKGHDRYVQQYEKEDEFEAESVDYGQSPSLQMSSYDPRSADAVLLLPGEKPSTNQSGKGRSDAHSVGGTVSEQSSLRTLGSANSRMPTVPGCPSQEDVRRYQYHPNAHQNRSWKEKSRTSLDEESAVTLTHLSANTLTIQGPPVQPIPLEEPSAQRHLESTSSGIPNTSMWSVESTGIQTARPMKKQHSRSRSQNRLVGQTGNDEAKKLTVNSLENHVIDQEVCS